MPDALAFEKALPTERVQQLRSLIEEVLEANKQFNLTAIRDFDSAWIKHIADSMQGLRSELFEGRKTVIDVGSGPGFPGLALAVARPELKVTLLDSTRKKCDFIKATAEKLGLNAKPLCDRAEEAGQSAVWRERFDIATARAVGGISEVCELALPLVKPGGSLVLWRGEAAAEEAVAARSALNKLGAALRTHDAILPYELPGLTTRYHLVIISKLRSTHPKYPRRTGIPKQQPL
jgi:16S rRNA (guanine527-N7)-methyltransferase